MVAVGTDPMCVCPQHCRNNPLWLPATIVTDSRPKRYNKRQTVVSLIKYLTDLEL